MERAVLWLLISKNGEWNAAPERCNLRESAASCAIDMRCAAESNHLNEGILYACGIIACGLLWLTDDTMYAIALKEELLGWIIVGSEEYACILILFTFLIEYCCE